MPENDNHGQNSKYNIINSDLDSLDAKERHWDRLFPERKKWYSEQMDRAKLEASSFKEFVDMSNEILRQEMQMPEFAEYWSRSLSDARADFLDRRESVLRIRYLYLFGIASPLTSRILNGSIKID